MSIVLAGGATGPADAIARFVRESSEHAQRRGADPARIVIVTCGRADLAETAATTANDVHAAAASCGLEITVHDVTVELTAGGAPARDIDLTEISLANGLAVSGGLTPGYWQALSPLAGDIRRLVSEGVPYLGFSAGAMIAPTTALMGGYRIGGVAVTRRGWSEELDEVEFREGLGLLDVPIEVHAAQQGLLARTIAAVEAGLIDGALAVDEHTALVVGEGSLEIVGDGSVWTVLADEAPGPDAAGGEAAGAPRRVTVSSSRAV